MPGQHSQAWWRSKQWHQQPSKQGQECIQNAHNIWRSQHYNIRTKLRLNQSCVFSTLLYGSECWRMTVSNLTKLSVFHTRNLRRIKRVFWPKTISNEELLTQCYQERRRSKQQAIILFKALHNPFPTSLNSVFKFTSSVHSHNLRNSKFNLFVPILDRKRKR